MLLGHVWLVLLNEPSPLARLAVVACECYQMTCFSGSSRIRGTSPGLRLRSGFWWGSPCWFAAFHNVQIGSGQPTNESE